MKKRVIWLSCLLVTVLLFTMRPCLAADPPGFMELYYAVQNDDMPTLKVALKKHSKLVNHKNGELLQGALGMLKDPKVISMLLAAGANPNLKQANTGYNGLHIVLAECTSGTLPKVLALVKLLVAKGCDVNLKDTAHEYTPLHMAARRESVSAAVFAALLSSPKVDVNLRCKQINPSMDGAWPALFYVLERPHDPTGTNKEIVQMLINKGADMKAMSTDKAPAEKRSWTVMHFVSGTSSDRADIAAILLAAGAALDQRDTREGLTPLHVAMNSNCPKICQFLLEKGADFNSKDVEGTSVLAHARGWATDKHYESAEVVKKWADAHK